MKKFFILSITGLVTIVLFNSFKSKTTLSNPNPPSNYTGAPTQSRYCTNCHGDFSINTAGGSVVATGLPTGFYVPGQVYNFSIKITNAVAAQNWGFEIKAVVSGGSTVLGTFTTTNANTTVSGSELKNTTAVVSNGTSYTYNNLKWTAPSTGTSPVSFYMTAVAGDNDGSEAGDFVYSNTNLNTPIPVTLGDITGKLTENAAIIEWNTFTESGSRHFELERSGNGRDFDVIKTISSSGNSNSIKFYNCVDNNLPENEKILYYRLKMVDLNGAFQYSKVIILKPSLITYIEQIYPTVINKNDLVHVKMVSYTVQQASISIYSSNGMKMSEQVQLLQKGGNEFTINSFNMKNSGIYLVKIKAGNFTETRKLLVQ
jgi:hypothetical protein